MRKTPSRGIEYVMADVRHDVEGDDLLRKQVEEIWAMRVVHEKEKNKTKLVKICRSKTGS
jgi:hypothetical protein